ncbi:TPA: conjugal transfer protein TraP, partial [Escherichia coli]
SDLAMPPSVTCGFRRGDAAEYARETDRSLMQRGSALWAILALVYASLALFISETVMLFPLGVVTIFVILLYFCS